MSPTSDVRRLTSAPIGDGENSSPLGEEKVDATWSRATLALESAQGDGPKTCNWSELRGIGSPCWWEATLSLCATSTGLSLEEHELEILSSKVARDHVHV